MKKYDVIIIGGGPAGLTAALYASRAGLETLLLEAGMLGGKMLSTSDIENWPGTMPTTGPELATSMSDHALKFGATHINAMVKSITKEENLFTVTDVNGKTYEGMTVICATGSTERHLGIKGEADYAGMGVSYCAVCDGAFFRDKTVAVIGGGNSAFEEAVYLTKFAKKVYIVLRRDVARADAVPVNHAKANDKIEIIYNKKPVEIKGNGMKLTSILFEDSVTHEPFELEADGLFPFVGLDPVTEFVTFPIKNDKGFIEAKQDMSTAIDGFYAAGDCRNTSLRQIVTASGDGAIAAQSANAYIQNMK